MKAKSKKMPPMFMKKGKQKAADGMPPMAAKGKGKKPKSLRGVAI